MWRQCGLCVHVENLESRGGCIALLRLLAVSLKTLSASLGGRTPPSVKRPISASEHKRCSDVARWSAKSCKRTEGKEEENVVAEAPACCRVWLIVVFDCQCIKERSSFGPLCFQATANASQYEVLCIFLALTIWVGHVDRRERRLPQSELCGLKSVSTLLHSRPPGLGHSLPEKQPEFGVLDNLDIGQANQGLCDADRIGVKVNKGDSKLVLLVITCTRLSGDAPCHGGREPGGVTGLSNSSSPLSMELELNVKLDLE